MSAMRQKTREAFGKGSEPKESAELQGYKSECGRVKNNYTQLFDSSKAWIDSLSRMKIRGDLVTNSFEAFNEHHIHRGGASLLEASKIFKELHKVINDSYVSISQNFVYPINNLYLHDITELHTAEDKLNHERLKYEDAKHVVDSKGTASPNTVMRASASYYNDSIDNYSGLIKGINKKTETDMFKNFKVLVEELHKYFEDGNRIFSGETNIRVPHIENQMPGPNSPHIKSTNYESDAVLLEKKDDLHNSNRSIPEYRYDPQTTTSTGVVPPPPLEPYQMSGAPQTTTNTDVVPPPPLEPYQMSGAPQTLPAQPQAASSTTGALPSNLNIPEDHYAQNTSATTVPAMPAQMPGVTQTSAPTENLNKLNLESLPMAPPPVQTTTIKPESQAPLFTGSEYDKLESMPSVPTEKPSEGLSTFPSHNLSPNPADNVFVTPTDNLSGNPFADKKEEDLTGNISRHPFGEPDVE